MATLLIAWVTFRLDRAATSEGEVRAAAARLRSVKDQFFGDVGPLYFSGLYTREVAQERAASAEGRMDQVFLLPVEPIAALVTDQRPVEAGLVAPETMLFGTRALWQINKINELVRKQGLFNAVHAPDFVDQSLRTARRDAVMAASVLVSFELHHWGIGNARDSWYTPFEVAVDRDLAAIAARGQWRNALGRNLPLICLDIVAFSAFVVVALAFATAV